jgi:AcrR family transcriptional regulator
VAPQPTDRSVVLLAARRVVLERGLGGAQVERIAHAAGVSRATIYRIVGGRNDLVQALLLEEARPLFEQVEAAVRGSRSGAALIESGVNAALAVIAERPLLRRLATDDLDLILVDLTTHAGALIGEVVAMLTPILAEARDRQALPLDTDVAFLAEELVRYVIGLLHTPTLGGTSRDPTMAADRAKRTFALWASLAASEKRPAMSPYG